MGRDARETNKLLSLCLFPRRLLWPFEQSTAGKQIPFIATKVTFVLLRATIRWILLDKGEDIKVVISTSCKQTNVFVMFFSEMAYADFSLFYSVDQLTKYLKSRG
jgi:hypothetical protein